MFKRGIAALSRETVVLHTKDGQSFRGVVIGVHTDAIVLAHTTVLYEMGEEQLPNDVLIPRTNVSWLQRGPFA